MKGRFCLQSTASFKQINQAHTNKSKSKQTYSFCRSSRFMQPKLECKKSTYNGHAVRSRRSGAGIGYGPRSDFTKVTSISPSSSKYKLQTIFDQNESSHKGYSLALSRDKIKFQSYIDSSLSRIPSSNHYQHNQNHQTKYPIYSMRKKTSVIHKNMSILSQNNNPGPGNYDNNPQDFNTSHYSSKFNRIQYSTSKSKRFDSNGNSFIMADNHVPGPGKYEQLSALSKVGKYVVSSHMGGTRAKFDSEKRMTQFERDAQKAVGWPGPGYYKQPSQFGQYDGDIYKQLHTIDMQSTITRNRK